MTLALPTSTPIHDAVAAALGLDDLDLHFATARGHLDDDLDAHFASIPVDTASLVIDAEVIDVVDTPAAAPADDIVKRKPVRFDIAMCILAFGAVVGAIVYFYIEFVVA